MAPGTNWPRICFVCGNIYPLLANLAERPVVGGSEVQELLISQDLRRRGFPISFVTEEYGQGPESSAGGFRVLSFRLGRNKVIQALTLLQALSRADAEIYYVRGMPKYGALIYLFCRVTRRKIVQALASDIEVEPENVDGTRGDWTFRAHTAWRRRADLVIAQTRHQAERLRTRWHITAQLAPNIVPVAAEPARPARSLGRMRVLWVGRLAPVKRVAWVAEIARRLPEMEFVVIGGGTSDARDHFDFVVPLLQSCANVRWLGFVPYHQVDALFQPADVLLHTSPPGHEGFPNVFLQAWAAGIPVVSTGVDPDNLLTAGGLGVCTSTVDQAVAALRQLAADPAHRQAIGGRGRRHVWENHRPEAVIPRMAEWLIAL